MYWQLKNAKITDFALSSVFYQTKNILYIYENVVWFTFIVKLWETPWLRNAYI